jgi:hypothetical protein
MEEIVVDTAGTTSAITVTVSYQDGESGFIVAKQQISVTPGLAESYGYSYADDVNSNEVTVYDALVKIHAQFFEEAFTAAPTEFLDISPSGTVIKSMGEGTLNLIFFVNGDLPNSNDQVRNCNQATVLDGDSIEFYIIKDLWCMDAYVYFNHGNDRIEKITVDAGTPINLTVKGCKGIMWKHPDQWEDEAEVIQDAAVVAVVVDSGVGAFGDIYQNTDEDGNLTLQFDDPGNYIISAIDGANWTAFLSPWCEVLVS